MFLADLKLSLARLMLFQGMTESSASLLSEVSLLAARADNPRLDANLNMLHQVLNPENQAEDATSSVGRNETLTTYGSEFD